MRIVFKALIAASMLAAAAPAFAQEVIVTAQRRNDLLQNVAVAARDAHGVALNRRLHLELRVLDELDDLFGFVLRDTLLQGNSLANRSAQG